MSDPKPKSEKELISTMKLLTVAVTETNKNERLGNSLLYSFLKGIAYSFGALTVAVIVIPIFAWLLSSVAWPPLVADFVTKVIEQIDQGGRPTSTMSDDQ